MKGYSIRGRVVVEIHADERCIQKGGDAKENAGRIFASFLHQC